MNAIAIEPNSQPHFRRTSDCRLPVDLRTRHAQRQLGVDRLRARPFELVVPPGHYAGAIEITIGDVAEGTPFRTRYLNRSGSPLLRRSGTSLSLCLSMQWERGIRRMVQDFEALPADGDFVLRARLEIALISDAACERAELEIGTDRLSAVYHWLPPPFARNVEEATRQSPAARWSNR